MTGVLDRSDENHDVEVKNQLVTTSVLIDWKH